MRGRGALILTILATIVGLVLIYFFAVSPRRTELSEVRAEIESEEQRSQQLEAELERLQALQERAPELEAELAVIREFVPLRPEVPNLIFQIQEAANRAGLDFVQITPQLPKTPPEGAALAEVRMGIGAKGGYFAVQDFIRRLYDLDRALRLDNFSLATEEEGTVRLSMTGEARVFFELPETAAAPVPATTPAPTTSP